MPATGTPEEYPLEELSHNQEANGQINQAELDGKRSCRQTTLRKFYHNIQTNNLTGLFRVRLFKSELARNMINDGINVVIVIFLDKVIALFSLGFDPRGDIG